MRRVVAGVLLLAALILTAAPANAQSNPPQFGGTFDVIEVNGLIDPVTAGFIERSLAESEANGAAGVILQMESVGAAISDEEVAALATRIAEFEVPVSVWLGPSGNGRALGRAGQIALAASRIGISPGSEIGDFGESVLEGAALDSPFVSILEGGFAGEVVGYDELLAIGLEDRSLPIQDAPVILNHLLELPGFEDDILQAGDTLPNGSVLADDADATRIPVSPTRFVTLPLIDQQFHTFASPPVAYLLFIIGLGLLVFELFTAGVGIAGVLGAGSVLAWSLWAGHPRCSLVGRSAVGDRIHRLRDRCAIGDPSVLERCRSRLFDHWLDLLDPRPRHWLVAVRGRHRWREHGDAVGNARNGSNTVLDPDHRPRVDDRRGRRCRRSGRPRRGRYLARCAVAGPYEPRHAARRR